MGTALRLLAKLSGVTIQTEHTPPQRLLPASTQRRVTEKLKPVKYLWKPAQPLVWLSKKDAYSIESAVTGTLVLGSNGSGKTSLSRYFAQSFCNAGFGALVLAAKKSDRQWWIDVMKKAGRESDLFIIAPDQPWRFNVIEYDLMRAGGLAERIDNVMTTFDDVLAQAGQHFSGESQQWINAAKDLMRRAVAILASAHDSFTYGDIIDFIAEAPDTPERTKAPEFSQSEFARILASAQERNDTEFGWPDFDRMKTYWMRDYPRLPVNTRESARFVLNHLQGNLETGRAKELFGTTTNITPEDTFDGAVIFVDLPMSESSNIAAQMLFKIVWQSAVLRRGDALRQRLRPVALWIDEAHLAISPSCTTFLGLCRQAGGVGFYITQNLSSLYQRLPGPDSKATANALLGYFQTQIFCAQADRETLKHTQELFDKEMIKLKGVSLTTGSGSSENTGQGDAAYAKGKPSRQGGQSKEQSESHAESWQEHMHEAISFRQLTSLKTGGGKNAHRVGAFVFNTGRIWKRTKTSYLYTEFVQR